MHLSKHGAELDQGKWAKLIRDEIPELYSLAHLEIGKIFFEDSSDINHHHWTELARYIFERYHQFDGFVILHGTDTMAYTASALSFALQNLGKPVILTGSQVPMSNLRSDARRNLINSIELATKPVPEVAICFNDHLFRGNRCTKMTIGDFDAFSSPNFNHLAEIGLEIEIFQEYDQIKPGPVCKPYFDNSVQLIKIFPGLNPKFLNCLDLAAAKAIVVEAFGTGNFPIKEKSSLLPFIERCKKKGVHLVITSQAPYDAVDLKQYKSGREALRLGALSAGDMTTEAVITKLMFLLGCKLADDEFIEQFNRNLTGERSR